MKSLDFGRYALSIFAAAGVLASCGGPQPPIGAPSAMQQRAVGRVSAPAPSRPVGNQVAGPDTYKVSSSLLYVSDWINSKIRIYDAKAHNPAPIATIVRGISEPNGDCMDASGTLYVTNSQGWVSEYALGRIRSIRKITKGIQEAAACAIDPNGNLWVANLSGYLVKYKQGSTTPDDFITRGSPFPVGIAIDHKGRLYVSNRLGSSSGIVQVYAAGSDRPTRTITDGVTSPVGITIDAKGTLYVTNDKENNVEEYLAGQNHPYQTITQGLNYPDTVTVNTKGRLYVGNFGNGVILEFAPGSLTRLKAEIHRRLRTPQGLAYYPPMLP
jgi:hypothetical protein